VVTDAVAPRHREVLQLGEVGVGVGVDAQLEQVEIDVVIDGRFERSELRRDVGRGAEVGIGPAVVGGEERQARHDPIVDPRPRPGDPAPAPRVPGRRPELAGAPGSELPGDSDPAGPELPRRPRAPPAPPCPAAGQQREKERSKRKKEKGEEEEEEREGGGGRRGRCRPDRPSILAPFGPAVDPRAAAVIPAVVAGPRSCRSCRQGKPYPYSVSSSSS